MDKERPGIMIYFDVLPAVERLSKENAGILLQAMLRYGKYRNARQANDALRRAGSLDAPIGNDDGDATLADMIPAAPELEDLAIESLYIRQLHDALEAAMNDLSPQQRMDSTAPLL